MDPVIGLRRNNEIAVYEKGNGKNQKRYNEKQRLDEPIAIFDFSFREQGINDSEKQHRYKENYVKFREEHSKNGINPPFCS